VYRRTSGAYRNIQTSLTSAAGAFEFKSKAVFDEIERQLSEVHCLLFSQLFMFLMCVNLSEFSLLYCV